MQKNTTHNIMIVAGETSGDHLAAQLVRDCQEQLLPVHFFGMAGQQSVQENFELIQPYDKIQVMGLVEVLRHYPALKKAMNTLKKAMRERQPDLLILIDYPDFNLRLARFAQTLNIKVLFYVSPQIWAWRKNRIHEIKKIVQHMAVLFPFEKRIYENAGVPVSFVGHPLVEKLKVSKRQQDNMCTTLSLQTNAPVLTLMPGSRPAEIKKHLGLMLASARLMKKALPNLQVLLIQAPSLNLDQDLEPFGDLKCQRITQDRYTAMSLSDAILVTSGTATLECALLGKPMAIVYRMHAISYALLKHLLNIKHIGLCNIVSESSIAPELLQQNANPETIASTLLPYLESPQAGTAMAEQWNTALRPLREAQGITPMAHLIAQLLS